MTDPDVSYCSIPAEATFTEATAILEAFLETIKKGD